VVRQQAKISKYEDADLRLGVRRASLVENLLLPNALKQVFTPVGAHAEVVARRRKLGNTSGGLLAAYGAEREPYDPNK